MPEQPTTAVFKTPLIAWLQARLDHLDELTMGFDEATEANWSGQYAAYANTLEWVKNA